MDAPFQALSPKLEILNNIEIEISKLHPWIPPSQASVPRWGTACCAPTVIRLACLLGVHPGIARIAVQQLRSRPIVSRFPRFFLILFVHSGWLVADGSWLLAGGTCFIFTCCGS